MISKFAALCPTVCLFLFLPLSLLPSTSAVNATQPGAVPVPGKAVYIEKSNTLWVFSFSRNSQGENILNFIDLNQEFNTLTPPVKTLSSLIVNTQCPIMHFAQALPDADGVSINIFGVGSNTNGVYSSIMTICQFNTETNTWKQINNPINSPLARRNAAFGVTRSNLTFVFGGSSDLTTGLSVSSSYYPNHWHQDVSIYDSKNLQWLNTGLSYTAGPPRTNATITQISDTNGQLLIVGGSVITNTSSPDMVKNFPLANMSDILALDPRTSTWNNINAQGDEIPIGRKHHTTTLHPDGRTLVVIGGEYHNSSGAYLLNDVWTLDTRQVNNYTWSQPAVTGTGLYRSNHTSILIGDYIWVIAGTNLSAKAVDIQLLNTKDWSWTYLAVPSRIVSLPTSDDTGQGAPIGIIVGSVGGVLLILCLCVCVWWFRRRRVKPTTNKKHSGASVLHALGSTGTNNGDVQQHENLLKLYQEDQPPASSDNNTSATKADSKLASPPSMLTDTSRSQNLNVYTQQPSLNDWHKQPSQQTAGYSINNINTQPQLHDNNNYSYASENSSPPAMHTEYPSNTTPSHEQQYENNNYYFHDEYNHPDYHHRMSSSPALLGGYTNNSNNNRRSYVFWDAPTSQASHFAMESRFMLSPIHGLEDTVRPSYSLDNIHPQLSVQQQQHLQKPNEVDTNVAAPVAASPAGSITACASSSSILDDGQATESSNR